MPFLINVIACHAVLFINPIFFNGFSSVVLVGRKSSDFFPGKIILSSLCLNPLFLDIRHTSEMSFSVGISFHLAIKLPEVPSSVRISSFFSIPLFLTRPKLLRAEPKSNIHVGTALIDMFAKCGCVTEARSVFESDFSGCGGNLFTVKKQCCCSLECVKIISSEMYTHSAVC